jgi:glycosyltransferase involved in cell wall biosynthesis
MDVPLIEEVARLRPDWHWVFIGGKSNLIKLSGPNVHFLGPKPYSELPGYYRHIDVCVLPWNQENVFTSYGSAIKVREYLASGKPVVIAPLYEYLQMPGVRIYRTVEEFIALVTEALACDTARERQLRQNAVRNCTWDVRAREVANLFRRLLDGQSVAQSVAPGNGNVLDEARAPASR